MTKGFLILLTVVSAALLAACSGLGAVAPSDPGGAGRGGPMAVRDVWPDLAESLGDGDWRILSTTRPEGVPPRFEIFRTGAGGASQVQLLRQ